MSENRVSFRLNMDKYSHRLVYEIYTSIPKSQRSDYIRLAMILMNDREEQMKRMKKILTSNPSLIKEEQGFAPEVMQEDMSESAKNMLSFISKLNTQ